MSEALLGLTVVRWACALFPGEVLQFVRRINLFPGSRQADFISASTAVLHSGRRDLLVRFRNCLHPRGPRPGKAGGIADLGYRIPPRGMGACRNSGGHDDAQESRSK